MKVNISEAIIVTAMTVIFVAAPPVMNGKNLFSYYAALADRGGNGHGGGNGGGHGGGHGNAGGNSAGKSAKSASQAAKPVKEKKLKKVKSATASRGKLASKLGALNAYHASPKAFDTASPNSRVGRIAAYWDKLQEFEEGGITPEEQAQLDDLLNAALNKPIDAETREAFNQLLRDKFADHADDGEDGEDETQ